MICFGGVCIPCSLLWPVLLLAIKPIYEFLAGIFGWQSFDAKKAKACCPVSGTCSVDGATCPGAAAVSKANDTSSEHSDDTNIDEPKSAVDNYVTLSEDHPTHSSLESVLNTTTRVFVKFTAKWCKPCKKIEPHFVSLSKQYKDATFVNVDIDEFEDLAVEYGVSSIPLFVALDSRGQKLGALSGSDESKLTEFIRDHA